MPRIRSQPPQPHTWHSPLAPDAFLQALARCTVPYADRYKRAGRPAVPGVSTCICLEMLDDQRFVLHHIPLWAFRHATYPRLAGSVAPAEHGSVVVCDMVSQPTPYFLLLVLLLLVPGWRNDIPLRAVAAAMAAAVILLFGYRRGRVERAALPSLLALVTAVAGANPIAGDDPNHASSGSTNP